MYSGIPVKVTDDVFALLKNGDEIFRGTKKEIDELVERLKKMPEADTKKFIDELIILRSHSKPRQFSVNYKDHVLRGEIEIRIIHNNNKKNVKETYKYATGKGGKSADQITPPWQAQVKTGGVHMHNYIDGINIKKEKIIERVRLHTGEIVEKVEVSFYVKELNGFFKRKTSTLWPKNWSMEKIKRITQEASENVIEIDRFKLIGISKERYYVEFYTNNDIINTSYISLKHHK